jgi:hypothetical protein
MKMKMADKRNEAVEFRSPLQIEFEREFLLSIPVYFKNSKIEKFCNLIALHGKNATSAYKEAFIGSKASDKTIYEHSSRLANRADILQRIHQLRVPVIAKTALTFNKLCQQLKEVAQDDREKTQSARVKAIELGFKLLGINLDAGININGAEGMHITLNFNKKDKEL